MTRFSPFQALTAVLLSAAATIPAQADDAGDPAALSARFTQLAGAKGSRSAPPDEHKAELASIAAKLADHRRLLRDGRFAAGELEQLVGICGASGEVLSTYLDFGMADAVGKNDNALLRAVKTNALTRKNTALYQEQVVPLTVFINKCNAAMVSTVRTMLPASGAQMEGWMRDQVLDWRSAFTIQFTMLASVASDTSVTLGNRQAVYASISEAAPTYAQVLSQPQRARVLAQLGSQTAALPAPFRAMHEQMIEALRSAPCGAMCQLQ